MDTKPLQKQAENFVTAELLKYEFKVTEPFFDEEGTDLLIVKSISTKITNFLKVQCKGRNIRNGSSVVRIPSSYIEENFVFFMYVIDQEKKDFLYLFLPEDINLWNKNKKEEFTLSINKNRLFTDYFTSKIFTNKSAEILTVRLNRVQPKNYTSIFIDGIFLEKAMDKTLAIYKKIWPQKKFLKPDLISVLKNILDSYDRYKSEKKIVNCYVFLSESFHLEKRINFSLTNPNFITKSGNLAKVFISKTDEIIGFEILEQLHRLINNDNIILVANDRIYESELENLSKKGVDVIVVKFNQHNDNDMLTEFRWGDIIYPLGFSIGLDRSEI